MSNQIPPPETPERETFNDTVFATLENGHTYCLECYPLEGGIPYPVRVYGINVAPYSLVCHQCKALLIDGAKMSVDGITPLCIWDDTI